MDSVHRLILIRHYGQTHWRCLCKWDFRHMACHHSALLSALWGPYVGVPSYLSEAPIQQPKGKTVFTIFPCDMVSMRRSASNNPSGNPRSQALTTLSRLHQRQRRAGGQRRRARHSPIMTRARHSPSQTLTTSRSLLMPRRELLDASSIRDYPAARPSSQQVLSPLLYNVISLLTYVPHMLVWMMCRPLNLCLQQALNKCTQYVTCWTLSL
jgi:hypothetical protein